MNSLTLEIEELRAVNVSLTEEALTLDLNDGRTVIVPLIWYPRLWHGTATERNNFEIIGDGTIIHWPELDEDLSIADIAAGRRSGESQKSLKKWLEQRRATKTN
jgi:hypothetical protein